MTEIKINDKLAQQAKESFAKQGISLNQGVTVILNEYVSLHKKDLTGPLSIDSLNDLFKKLNKSPHSQTGVGNAILGEHHSTKSNGIGNNILKH